jgi:hypothetical protein
MPEVQQRVADIVKDVITKYDVDGIVWDDYFYPDLGTGSLNDQADYIKYGGGQYATIEQFRIANVNKVIQLVQQTIAENNPGVIFSLSPTSSYNYNKNTLFADVEAWCKGGWCDVIMPQIYQSTENKSSFSSFLDWWTNISGNKAVTMVAYPLYKFGVAAEIKNDAAFASADELVKEFALANANENIKGGALYNASPFRSNPVGVIDSLKNIYKHPALIPVLGRKSVDDPEPITDLTLTDAKLSWSAADGMHYAVYRVVNETGILVGVTQANTFKVTERGLYCVTVVNRDNVESPVSNPVSYQPE